MDAVDFREGALPSPRTDLELFDGGHFADQSPRWVLFDHVADEFFELDSVAARIFRALLKPLPFKKWLQSLQTFEPQITFERVNETLNFFLNEGLLSDADPRVQAKKHQNLGAAKKSIFQVLLHNYLFFKVPLISPEPWIGTLADGLGWLRSRPVLVLRLMILACAGGILLSRFGELTATFVDYVSFEWIVVSVICIAFFKVIHELAHGVAAKWHGARVSQMGIAFLLLLPILYTDATDAWRIKDPKQRRKISIAGVSAELQIAALALVAWSVLPEGWARSLCFVMFLSGLIPSLLVNLNPFMRFDAYFWLSDYWGVTNLQARAFSAGRAWMRHWVFGLPVQPSGMSIDKELKLAVFSYCVWVYRFFLFLGIALLVYSIDFKLLGIFLFIVEIWVFIARPIYRELATVWGQRGHFRLTKTSIALMSGLLLFIAWIAFPATSHLNVQAVLKPAQQVQFVAENTGELVSLRRERGEVRVGDVLFSLSVPSQTFALREAELKTTMARAHLDAAQRGQLPEEIDRARQNVDGAKARLNNVHERIDRLTVHAQFAGYWWPAQDLSEGARVLRGQQLGTLVAPEQSRIVAYLPQTTRVDDGSQVEFWAETGKWLTGDASIERSPTAERTLSSPLFASALGGDLAATYSASAQGWVLVSPLYRVSLTMDRPFEANTYLRGTLILNGTAQSRLRRWAGVFLNDLRNEIQW